MKLYLLGLLLITLSILGCNSSTPVKLQKDDKSGYFIVETNLFHQFLISDKTIIEKYSSLTFDPLNLEKYEIAQSTKSSVKKTWSIYDRDKERLTNTFNKAVASNFNEGSPFSLSSESSSGTLRVSFRLKEYKPLFPKPGSESTVGSYKIASYGLLAFQVILSDSTSGKFVGIIEHAEYLNASNGAKNNPSNYMRAVSKMFGSALGDLEKSLVELKSMKDT